MAIFNRAPIHFRTLPQMLGGVTPRDFVDHDDLFRVMYRPGFNGLKLTVIASPTVSFDYDFHGTFHISASGNTRLERTFARGDVGSRLRSIQSAPAPTASSPPFLDSMSIDSPPLVWLADNFTSITTYTDTANGIPRDQKLFDSSDVYPNAQHSGSFDAGELKLGFARSGRGVALIFCTTLLAHFSSYLSPYLALSIYAPINGASPDDFYRLPQIPDPGDVSTGFGSAVNFVNIDETGAGSLFGVQLKVKGWTGEVVHDGSDSQNSTGTETYAASLTIEET